MKHIFFFFTTIKYKYTKYGSLKFTVIHKLVNITNKISIFNKKLFKFNKNTIKKEFLLKSKKKFKKVKILYIKNKLYSFLFK